MADTETLQQELASKADDLREHLDWAISTKNDPRWTAELQRLKQVLNVLGGLATMWRDIGEDRRTEMSRDIGEDRRTESYGFQTLLLPESHVRRLTALVERLQEIPLVAIEPFIDMRRQLTSELGTAIDDAKLQPAAEDWLWVLTRLRIELANEAALEVLSDAAAVSQAKAAQQETAGDVAESELAKEFAMYENQQQRKTMVSSVSSYSLLHVGSPGPRGKATRSGGPGRASPSWSTASAVGSEHLDTLAATPPAAS